MFTRSLSGRLILLFLVAVLLAADVVATYHFFTSRYPGANDFASRWAGARAFWVDGVSPYSDEATRQIQMLIYGRPIPPEEEQEFDPGPFAYPFYTVFLLFPIVWMPYPWAEAVWLVVLEVSLLAGLLLALRLYDWRPPRWLLLGTAVWVFVFYPHARALLLGQFAIFVFAIVALALWALKKERDVLAGFCMALSTFKPQMIFLLIPLLLWWAVRERRWRFVASSAGWMALFLGASWIVEPRWLCAFAGQVGRYTSYTAIGSPIWIITHIAFPSLGTWGEWVLSGLAVAGLVWASWWALRLRQEGWFDWAVGLCLVVTNLVAVRTATTNYVILLLPLVMVFRALQRRRVGVWWILLIEVVLLVGMWVLFLTTLQGKFEHPSVYLPLPFGLLAVFVLARYWLVGEG
ncbi:MAG: glycosyltransferase family 87 protein [Anaerolineae bacterium]